jgi:hypothetical protein
MGHSHTAISPRDQQWKTQATASQNQKSTVPLLELTTFSMPTSHSDHSPLLADTFFSFYFKINYSQKYQPFSRNIIFCILPNKFQQIISTCNA